MLILGEAERGSSKSKLFLATTGYLYTESGDIVRDNRYYWWLHRTCDSEHREYMVHLPNGDGQRVQNYGKSISEPQGHWSWVWEAGSRQAGLVGPG